MAGITGRVFQRRLEEYCRKDNLDALLREICVGGELNPEAVVVLHWEEKDELLLGFLLLVASLNNTVRVAQYLAGAVEPSLLAHCYNARTIRRRFPPYSQQWISLEDDFVTPLHLASLCGSVDVMSVLITAGAPVNACTLENKRTPLHMSSECGLVDATKCLLLNPSVNLDSQDHNGYTPLDSAAVNKHVSCVVTMLSLVRSKLKRKQGLQLVMQTTRRVAISKSSPCLPALLDFVAQHVDDYSRDGNDADTLRTFGSMCGNLILKGYRCELFKALLPAGVMPKLALEAAIAFDRHQHKDYPLAVVRFLGHPGAGATELMSALVAADRRRGLRRHDSSDGAASNNRETSHRAGPIRRICVAGAVYVDLGEVHRFVAANRKLLVSSDLPALHIIVVSAGESIGTVREHVRQWVEFLTCSRRKDGAKKDRIAIVATQASKTSRAQRDAVLRECHLLKADMGGHQYFFANPVFFVDAFQGACSAFDERRLREVIQEMVMISKKEVGTCRYAVEIYLAEVRKRSGFAQTVATSEFQRQLAECIVGVPIAGPRLPPVVAAVKEIIDLDTELLDLHRQAQLLHFPDAELIVLEPTCLMSDVARKLLSPKKSPAPHIDVDENGMARRADVIRVLDNAVPVPGDVAFDVACQLGVCLQAARRTDQVLVLPALQEHRTSRHWPAAEHLVHESRTGCKVDVALSCAVIAAVQLALVDEFGADDDGGGRAAALWRTGIAVTEPSDTQCLVEVTNQRRDVSVITRGADSECVAALQERVWHRVRTLCAALSPGSTIVTSTGIAEPPGVKHLVRELDTAME